MEVNIQIQAAPETLDEGDRPSLGFGFFLWDSRWGSFGETHFFAVVTRDGRMSDGKSLDHDFGLYRQAHPKLEGEAQHPLSDVLQGQHRIHKVGCRLAHTPSPTAGAEPPTLAAKCDEMLELTALAASPQKPMGQYPTLQVFLKLLDHEIREGVPSVPLNLRLKGKPVVLNQFIEYPLFWQMPIVGEWLTGGIECYHEEVRPQQPHAKAVWFVACSSAFRCPNSWTDFDLSL